MLFDDITFCGSDCNNKKCIRHPSNIREPNIPHSFAYLKDTDHCPLKKKEVRLNAPTIEPKKVEGEWIDHSATFWECPDCGHLLEKCCPNCQREVVLPNKALNEIIKYLKDDTVTWRDISDDIIIQILEDNGLW